MLKRVEKIEDKYGIQRGQLLSYAIITVGILEILISPIVYNTESSPVYAKFMLGLGMTTAYIGIFRTFYVACKHNQQANQNSASETVNVNIPEEPSPLAIQPEPSSPASPDNASRGSEPSTADANEQDPINSSKRNTLC